MGACLESFSSENALGCFIVADKNKIASVENFLGKPSLDQLQILKNKIIEIGKKLDLGVKGLMRKTKLILGDPWAIS